MYGLVAKRRAAGSFGFAISLAGTLLAMAHAPAAAQRAAAAPADQTAIAATDDGVRIQRISDPPVIDGRLDEEVWLRAPIVRDFRQVNPVEFAEPSEQTEVYLLYDRDTLYIGARMYDSNPELILARILRQGQAIGSDDRFFVHLDPYNNRRGGYLFGVNPNGVRYDGIFENINNRSFDWDGIWLAAATIDEQGWVAEIAIPFKTISFDPTTTTWRMNFARNIERKNESMAWSSRNRDTDLSTMREVRGISQIEQGMGLDIVPSVSVQSTDNRTTLVTETETQPSVDVFYKITPQLNGSLTVNTDFSATEVDDRQVNLTRFSLFFPERRDFFLQDVDIFQFGRLDQDGRPFFSRTLGIGADGTEVPIDFGGKISGRIGRFDIGTLAVRQEANRDVDATTAFVGRVAANVLRESSLGMIVTDGDPASNLDNSVMGVDFRFLNSRFRDGRGMDGEVWLQQSDTEGITGDERAMGLAVRFPAAAGWRGGFNAQRFEENFNPALGFVRRTGVDSFDSFVNYQWRPSGGLIRTINSGVYYQSIEFLDTGETQSEQFNLNLLNIDFNSQDSVGFGTSRSKEGLRLPFEIYRGIVLDPGLYTFESFNLNVRTGNQRKVGIGMFSDFGEFYNGDRTGVGGFLSIRPNSHFRANINYQVNDVDLPQGSFVTRVMRLRLEAIFSNTLSWTNLIQYDNVSDTIGLNSRLHWIPQAGREAFIVFNHNARDPTGGHDFHSISSDVSLKFSYTFRF